MWGLIKKDFLVIKANIRLVIIMCALFIIMSLKGDSTFLYFLPAICLMLFISTFSYDDFNKWNAYVCTLPGGRTNVVKSKYISTIIFIMGATILVPLIGIGIIYIQGEGSILDILKSLGAVVASLLVCISLLYPFIFKYGSEKGRIILFVLVFGLVFLINILMEYVPVPVGLINFLNTYGIYFIGIVLLLLIIGSYYISKRIYLKKEF